MPNPSTRRILDVSLSPDSGVSSDGASDASQELLQERIAFFGKLGFFISLPFLFCTLVVSLDPEPTEWMQAVVPQTLWVLTVPLLFVAMWQVASRASLSAQWLQVFEAAMTFLFAIAFATVARSDGEIAKAFQPIAYLLLLRAAFVPSRGRRTLLIGALCLVPAVVMGVTIDTGGLTLFLLVIRASMAVGIATAISHVIYGLQLKVRDAQELGQYKLEEKIAEGGMSEIYRARHRLLRRPTAIKLFRPEKAGDSGLARFEREVQLTSGLTNPHTVAIYDYGRTDDGVFYYAMEYLPGTNLFALVRETGPQPPGRVIHLLTQVCASLYEAHSVGLIHRDVKPENIILCERGKVFDVIKVVDFGLARRVQQAPGTGVTAAGVVLGTPYYLSPEAINSPEKVQAQSDLYALGAVGYFLITGNPPFRGKDFLEISMHHLNTEPEKLSERLGSAVPSDLEQIILGCLAKKPEDRPADAAALGRALSGCKDAGAWTQQRARAWWHEHGEKFKVRQ